MPTEQQWIIYPIFVSSTFRDMDQERDIIKFEVIHQLNTQYRKRFVQFQVIDLRVGINTENLATEDERENHVLDICFKKIDDSRPFFICLLGGRYGWIPSDRRWYTIYENLDIKKRPLLEKSIGSSVTELEILYGAIGNHGEYLDNSVFMTRSEKSYDTMPETKKSIYLDEYSNTLSTEQKENHKNKLESLHNRIGQVAREKQKRCIIPYILQWDDKKNKFSGFESFKTNLFNQLCSEINKELDSVNQEFFTWQGQDKANAEALAHLLVKQSAITSDINHAIDLIKQGYHQILITGDVGSGKSTVAAHCYNYYRNHGYICCLGWIGLSTHSYQMRYLLIRWIQQLTEDENTYSEEYLLKTSEHNDIHLYQILNDIVQHVENKGDKVCFFLDGIEQLSDYHENELYQMWVKESMTVVLTAHESAVDHIRKHHPAIQLVTLGHLELNDLQLIIEQCEHSSNMQLPNAIREKLINRTLMPLQLKLIMLLFTQLSSSDYQTMRSMQEMDDITRINRYLGQVYESMPQELPELVRFVIHELISRIGLPTSYEKVFTWIAASQQGLRQNELSFLLGKDWDMLHFYSLAYLLSDLLVVDNFSQHIKIRSKFVRQALLPEDAKAIYQQISTCLLTLPDDDPLKQNILIYSLIEAEEPAVGIDYIGTFKKYDSREDIIRWSRTSANLLLADPDYLDHLMALALHLQPTQVIRLARILVKYGIDHQVKSKECHVISKSLLLNIDVEQLDAISSYLLGDTLLSSSSLFKTANNEIVHHDEEFIKIAYHALEHSYTLKPEDEDYKSMFMAVSWSLSDIEMKKGNYDSAKAIIKKARSIQKS